MAGSSDGGHTDEADALGPAPKPGQERDRLSRQASAAPDEAERARLEAEAQEATALADVLDERVAQLQVLGAGVVEAYAAYRAAWRALGRPEIDRAEHEMSDGALRSRIRAWEREQTWAPGYVGNELAGTRQAADTQTVIGDIPKIRATSATL